MRKPENPRGGRPRLKYRVEFLLFRRLLESFAACPLDAALERGARLGRLWHAVDGKHRRLANGNIRCGLGLDAAAAARTARICFENLGRTFAEFAFMGPRLGELLERVSLEGIEHLHQAAARGKGVFILGGHCGNWELFGPVLTREIPMTTLARPIKNPLVDELIVERRRAAGAPTLDPKRSTREILTTLQRGAAVGMVLDQSALRREGVFVPFLGRPASTHFGLALLAIRSGAPVLPAFIVREGAGRHRAWIGPPIPPAEEGDREERIGRTTARYTAAIEEYVRRFPEQWFWVHNRWQRQPLPGERVYQP